MINVWFVTVKKRDTDSDIVESKSDIWQSSEREFTNWHITRIGTNFKNPAVELVEDRWFWQTVASAEACSWCHDDDHDDDYDQSLAH